MVFKFFKRNKLRKLVDKGINLRKEGKFEESIKYYDEAIKLDPKFKYAWYNKGNVFRELKKPIEAIKCYDKTLEIDSKYTNAWISKGNALNDLEKPHDALNAMIML